MRRIIPAMACFTLACLSVAPARAQAPVAVATCGSRSLTAGLTYGMSQDLTGTLCTSAGSGGGGLSVIDSAAWTAAASAFTPGGGVFNDAAANLTAGQQGTFRLTNDRQIKVLDSSVLAAINSATAAGENHIGEIGSNQIKVQVAQTVTAASAYASGNAIGGLMTIAGATRVSGALGASGTGGILTGMMMNAKSLQTTQVDVVFFDANPTGSTCTDKTAFSLATADFDKVVGYLTVPGTAANGAGWVAGTVGSVGVATYYPMTYDLASSTSLFACAITRGTPTYTATTDVSFKFNILRN